MNTRLFEQGKWDNRFFWGTSAVDVKTFCGFLEAVVSFGDKIVGIVSISFSIKEVTLIPVIFGEI